MRCRSTSLRNCGAVRRDSHVTVSLDWSNWGEPNDSSDAIRWQSTSLSPRRVNDETMRYTIPDLLEEGWLDHEKDWTHEPLLCPPGWLQIQRQCAPTKTTRQTL